MYKLVCGSVFDDKCDLLIIPCNDRGGVTNSMSKELTGYGLPYGGKAVSLGHVYFNEYSGGYTNASVIGFAASVNTETVKCEEQYIHDIMKDIITYCKGNSIHLVNIPLLGTGAGRMQAEFSFDIIRSYFEKEDTIFASIYAYSQSVFKRLKTRNPEERGRQLKNPRVFISYTSGSHENAMWVRGLTCRLREKGVDARMDFFHLKPGYDLPQWMTNELIMADKVLLICDKYYAQKADSRNGGVGWETMIIQGDMLSHSETGKYICIVRDKDMDKSLPVYVRSKYALNWSDSDEIGEERLEELLYHLFDCNTEPPLGEIPEYIKKNFE